MSRGFAGADRLFRWHSRPSIFVACSSHIPNFCAAPPRLTLAPTRDESRAKDALKGLFQKIDANANGILEIAELQRIFGEHASQFLQFCDAGQPCDPLILVSQSTAHCRVSAVGSHLLITPSLPPVFSSPASLSTASLSTVSRVQHLILVVQTTTAS